jgi:Na+/H+ antiporter NhaD/arsenite permease-like protein
LLTMVGVTLLFAAVEANGTLRVLAGQATQLVRGQRWALPLLFFLVAAIVSMVGPGAISSVALLIPLAVSIGAQVRLPVFLTALAVTNGANAGNLSPISSVGVIVNSRMTEVGLGGHEAKVFGANLMAHLLVTVVAWMVWLARERIGWRGRGEALSEALASVRATAPLALAHRWTLFVVALWVVGVLVWQLPLGLSAFAAATLLFLGRVADQEESVRLVPWPVVLMVTGVATLISLLEKTGGLDLFTSLLARLASPGTVNGVMAMITGAISTYSSTSGVVLPAFLPTVPSLVERVGGGEPLAIALSINIGSALVDVSPLSTLGALCVAAVQDAEASRRLYHQLFGWGLSMIVVGAGLAQLLAGWLARL